MYTEKMKLFDYMTIDEAATTWTLHPKYIQKCCREGRILNAVKRGGIWFIPVSAKRPADADDTLRFKGRKRKIFEAAAQIFAEHSYDTICVKDITDAVGITQSAFYNHFKTKQEILNATYAFFSHYYTVDRPSVESLEPLLRDAPMPKILEAIYYEFDEEYRNLMITCIKVIMQRMFVDKNAGELFHLLLFKSNIDYLVTVFDRAIAIGRFAPFDTKAVAVYAVSIRCFGLMNYLTGDSSEDFNLIQTCQNQIDTYIFNNIVDLAPPTKE